MLCDIKSTIYNYFLILISCFCHISELLLMIFIHIYLLYLSQV